MSPRKKSPQTGSVEAVIWNDAYYHSKARLDTLPVTKHTVGFLVHEDDTQVVLAGEIAVGDDWLREEMDYTGIPKALIVSRTRIAEVGLEVDSAEEISTPKTISVPDGP